jgi:hypothetical protein
VNQTPGSEAGSRNFTQRQALCNPNPRTLPRRMPPHRRKQPNIGSLHEDWCPATLVRCSKRAKEKNSWTRRDRAYNGWCCRTLGVEAGSRWLHWVVGEVVVGAVGAKLLDRFTTPPPPLPLVVATTRSWHATAPRKHRALSNILC